MTGKTAGATEQISMEIERIAAETAVNYAMTAEKSVMNSMKITPHRLLRNHPLKF